MVKERPLISLLQGFSLWDNKCWLLDSPGPHRPNQLWFDGFWRNRLSTHTSSLEGSRQDWFWALGSGSGPPTATPAHLQLPAEQSRADVCDGGVKSITIDLDPRISLGSSSDEGDISPPCTAQLIHLFAPPGCPELTRVLLSNSCCWRGADSDL